jgi:hypothetical protein
MQSFDMASETLGDDKRRFENGGELGAVFHVNEQGSHEAFPPV